MIKATDEAEREGSEGEASRGRRVSFRLAVMVYICNPSIGWGVATHTQTGGSPFGIHPGHIDSSIFKTFGFCFSFWCWIEPRGSHLKYTPH